MMSMVARYRISVFLFYWIGNGIAAVIAWLAFPEWNALKTAYGTALVTLSGLIFLAGFVNVASQAMMVLTLKLGHNGISIAARNCAAVIPFLVGVLVWHNKVGIDRFIGLAMVLTGMAFIVLSRTGSGKTSRDGISVKWLLLTARLTPETLETGLRIPLLLTSCAVGNCIAFAVSRKRQEKTSIPWYILPGMAAAWSMLAIFPIFSCSGLWTA